MKISKKDLRRIIFEGVAASLEEKKKKKRGRRGKKDSETTAEDPPASTVSEPSDPTTATADESKKKALEFLSKAIEEHNKGNKEARQENLNLMKMIIAPPPNGLSDKYKTVAAHIKNKAKLEMGIDIDFSPKVSTKPQAQAQKARAAKPKSRSNPKTAYIQKVIKAPSSDGGKKEGDGQWGKKTSDAWRAWVKSSDTLKKFAALLAKEKGEKQADDERIEQLKILGMIDDDKGKTNESRDLYELFSKIISEQSGVDPDADVDADADADADTDTDADADAPEPAAKADKTEELMKKLPEELQKLIKDGDAAKIAAYFKLSPNLTGVDQLVRKLETVKTTNDKEEEKPEAAVDPDLNDATYLENLAEEGKLNMAAIPAEFVDTDSSEANNALAMARIVDTKNKFKEMADTEESGIVKDGAHPKTGSGNRKYVITYGDAFNAANKKISGQKDIKVDGTSFGQNFYLPDYTKKKIGKKEYYVAKNYRDFIPTTQKEMARALGMPVNENKDTAGESHGTLIRKRYRRY
tara:strand:- start:1142 stop:2710 length:1569 start_codon:yes stop_codon:yes gene_type:complete